jgi:ligand-binding sensor protein
VLSSLEFARGEKKNSPQIYAEHTDYTDFSFQNLLKSVKIRENPWTKILRICRSSLSLRGGGNQDGPLIYTEHTDYTDFSFQNLLNQLKSVKIRGQKFFVFVG